MKKTLIFFLTLFSILSMSAQNVSDAGYYFDGVDDQVSIELDQEQTLSSVTGGYTIELIINPDVAPVTSFEYHLLSFFNNGSSGSRVSLVSNSSNNGYQARFVASGSTADIEAGECTHIAWVATGAGSNGSSPTDLYINGNLDGTTNSFTQQITFDSLIIGAGNLSNYYGGLIKEVRVWNIIRSAQEINEYKNTSLTGTETGLVGYWKLNDTNSQIAEDDSPNSNTGVLGTNTNSENSDPILEDRCTVEENGLYFDGIDDQVSVALDQEQTLSSVTGGYTIELVINPDVAPVSSFEYHLLSFFNNGSSGSRVSLVSNSSNNAYQARFVASGSTADIETGECTHIAWVATGAGSNGSSPTNLYLNGSLDGTTNSFTQQITYDSLIIGAGNLSNYYGGLIKEVRIWSVIRSAQEINEYKDQELMGNETGLVGYWKLTENEGQLVSDISPNGNDGVRGTTDAVESSDPVSQAMCIEVENGLYFDGIDDQVSIDLGQEQTLSSVTGGYTIEMIINPDVAPVASFEYNLLSFFNDGSSGSRVSLVSNSSNNDYQARFVASGSTADIKTGECTHIAWVATGAGSNGSSPTNLYLNGNLDGTTNSFTQQITYDSLIIGAGNLSNYYGGLIKEVRIWSVIRSAQEINEYKNQELMGNETGLVGYWKLTEAGQTMSDASPSGNDGVRGLTNVVESSDPVSQAICDLVTSIFSPSIISKTERLNIYPNPSHGTFNVDILNETETTEIKIFNSTGVEVHSQYLESNNTTIHADQLSTGIYIIEIIQGGVIYNSSVVIE